MTNESKWVIAIVGLAGAVFLGWFLPFLWILFLGVVFILLVTPAKKKPVLQPVTQPGTEPVTHDNTQEIASQLEARVAAEENPDVRRGLAEALAMIQAAPRAPAYAAATTQSVTAPMVIASVPQLSKEEQELRNVNVILYTASFLLVGAAAAFIAVSEGVAPTAKFLLLLAVASAFYSAGLLLHSRSKRLRPAAAAFVGTGLALVPFVGLAGYFYVIPNGPLMWWLTSALGLGAFLVAVWRIQTNVMAYLTLAFVFSLATSSVSVLDAPFIWYFVSVIVTGSILTYLSYKRPRWLPSAFTVPLEQNAQLAVPVALIGSLFAIDALGAWDYAIITGVAALHYLVNSLGFSTDQTRAPYWSAARALLILFAATVAYAVSSDWQVVSIVLAITAVMAHVYSVRLQSNSPYERAWLGASQGLLTVSAVGLFDEMTGVSLVLLVLLLVSAHQLYVTKRVEFAIAGIIAGLALPLTVLRGVIEPPVLYEHIAVLLLVVAASFVGMRALFEHRHGSYKTVASIGYMMLLAEAVTSSVLSAEGGWIAGVLIASAGLLYAASYVERQPAIVAVANSVLVCGTILAFAQAFDEFTWVPLMTALTLGAAWYTTRWVLVSPQLISQSNVRHANIQMVSSVSIILAGALIAMFQSDTTVVAGALLGCVGAGLLAYEGYVLGARFMYEFALYVLTFSLQRLVGYVYPDAHVLLYTHWWALTGGLSVLLYRGRTGDWAGAQTRMVLSLCMLSIPTGLYALVNPNTYQLLFLGEHVALAVLGLLSGKRLLVLWGSIGVGLAVLWLLKSYTYLLLALIALGLIGLAVWRLMKKQ